MIRLGAIIRRYRIFEDITQKTLAKQIGVSPGAISSMEAGHAPSSETLLKVMKFVFEVK